MSKTVEDFFFSGQGRVHMAEIDSVTRKPKGFIHVGNAPVCKIGLKSESEDIPESMSGNQLIVKRIPRKKTADVTLHLSSFSKRNLEIALYGKAITVASGTVAAEPITAFLGTNIPLKHTKVSDVVIAGTGTNSAITYVLNKNYTVDATYGTIYFMTAEEQTDANAEDVIADEALLSVDYKNGSYDKITAFSTVGKEYVVRMEGVNTAESGRPMLATIWKFAPDPIKELSLIDDKTSPIDISGAALADTSRPDDDQFFQQIQM